MKLLPCKRQSESSTHMSHSTEQMQSLSCTLCSTHHATLATHAVTRQGTLVGCVAHLTGPATHSYHADRSLQPLQHRQGLLSQLKLASAAVVVDQLQGLASGAGFAHAVLASAAAGFAHAVRQSASKKQSGLQTADPSTLQEGLPSYTGAMVKCCCDLSAQHGGAGAVMGVSCCKPRCLEDAKG